MMDSGILPGMYNHIVIAVHFQKSTVCVCVSEVSEEEDGRGGGGSGYRTKNKKPTRQCGEKGESKRARGQEGKRECEDVRM